MHMSYLLRFLFVVLSWQLEGGFNIHRVSGLGTEVGR